MLVSTLVNHECEAAGGMSFVASCHHRVLHCFLKFGNSGQGRGEKAVSLQEVQAAVRMRHSGSATALVEAAENDSYSGDFS